MNKFHQISTDMFVPVDHDNSYLFNHYEKVANFLAFNLANNYKTILAKPVQNGYYCDWFSVHENLVNITEKNKAETELILIQYWKFIDVINAKIQELSNSNDENKKNWSSLLTKVFNHKDNFVFSNGNDLCIVWGWKFENNELYRPNILKNPNTFLNPDRNAVSTESPLDNNNTENKPLDDIQEPIIEDNHTEDNFIADGLIEGINSIEEVETEKKQHNFLEFLKWFASKYWWLLLIIVALTFVVMTYKLLTLTDKINNI